MAAAASQQLSDFEDRLKTTIDDEGIQTCKAFLEKADKAMLLHPKVR